MKKGHKRRRRLKTSATGNAIWENKQQEESNGRERKRKKNKRKNSQDICTTSFLSVRIHWKSLRFISWICHWLGSYFWSFFGFGLVWYGLVWFGFLLWGLGPCQSDQTTRLIWKGSHSNPVFIASRFVFVLVMIIIMDICKAPTLWLNALNKRNITHIIIYIKTETLNLTNS